MLARTAHNQAVMSNQAVMLSCVFGGAVWAGGHFGHVRNRR